MKASELRKTALLARADRKGMFLKQAKNFIADYECYMTDCAKEGQGACVIPLPHNAGEELINAIKSTLYNDGFVTRLNANNTIEVKWIVE